MTLILRNNGFISCVCDNTKKQIILNNSDLENLLFSKIFIQEHFNFNSLFRMFNNYPILLVLFPMMKDYLSEFESIQELNTEVSEFSLVLTPLSRFFNNLCSHQIICEVYDINGRFQDNLNISLMYLKDYSNFNISLNLLTIIENEIEDNSEIETSHLEIQIDEFYHLISFLKPIVDNITAFGTVRERNFIIEQLNEEQEILEVEADIMAANLLKKFKSSSGNNE